jgi:mycofactocin glycosyltransferase
MSSPRQSAAPAASRRHRNQGDPPTGLPLGFGVALDPGTRILDERTLVGGTPTRVVRLSESGAVAWRALQDGPVDSPATAALARRLTDAGMVHPRPATGGTRRRVAATVVIPVRDRATLLDRCLAGIADRYPVVVVDDGSRNPTAVAAVVARHGARLVRQAPCAGPAAARNAGLRHGDTELIAFLDSDCRPPPDWLESLAGHLDDPLVGAVAPRIVAAAADTPAGRYGAEFGSLDLGAREGLVAPGAGIGYVPSAALLARRSALDDVAADGATFDPALRYGEDVDLVWRLHRAGWRVRYDPSVEVAHQEPVTWRGVMGRRFRYGTSAGPLAVRHPGALAPLVLRPWPSAVVAAALARRPGITVACLAIATHAAARSLRDAGLPASGALGTAAQGIRRTWLGTGRYLCQFAGPALIVCVMLPGRRRWGRRAAVVSLLLAPALSPAAAGAGEQRQRRLDPVRRVLARLADDVCYGAGVYTGCLRVRTMAPLVPHVRWHRRRVSAPGAGGCSTR